LLQNETLPRLDVGDFIPQTALVDQLGRPTMFHTQDHAGHRLVLFLYRSAQAPALAGELSGFRDLAAQFAGAGVKLFAVSAEPAAANGATAATHALPFPILSDGAGSLLARFALPSNDGGTTIVADANLQIVGIIGTRETASQAQQALALCQTASEADPSAAAPRHAPVLVVPRIFDPLFCNRLIEVWRRGEKRENETSRGAAGTADYQARTDSDVKRRSDVLIPEGSNDLNLQIRDRLLRRVVPEIVKCFQSPVRSYEVARIGCYDASTGGYFRRHRDDVGDPAKPRRFALSVNLNEDFEGGGLTFPEYSQQYYRPATGGGVVFSCNLLHEAMPVTRGRRFGLFTFFR
jgi:peroxiredoxin